MDAFLHKPVMVDEVLAVLKPVSGGRYVDGTVGGGGHSEAILRASEPDGFLYGCDWDETAVEAALKRLSPFSGRFEIRRGSFEELSEWVPANSCDGVILDLGVSSPMLETAERGFSFDRDGPLDMRMDTRKELTAADVVNSFSEDELAQILREYGDVAEPRAIARAIVEQRRLSKITRTRELSDLVKRVSRRHPKNIHPATQVFMALRIYVNDELGTLRRGLENILKILKPGGRLAVITFHSGEDRVVKEFGRVMSRNYEVDGEVDLPEFRRPCEPKLRVITRKPILPAAEEIRSNPRSRSAKLRVFEKL